MHKYFIRRALFAVVTLLGVSISIFLIMRVLPGDPLVAILGVEGHARMTPADREKIMADLGLSAPLPVQYVRWMSHVVRGDLGRSLWMRRAVLPDVLDRFRATLVLTGTALLISTVGGVALGVLASTRPHSWLDRLSGVRAEYDGATKGRRAAGWRRKVKDANGELSPRVMALLRGIAHDLKRNNGHVARGTDAIAEHIVGTGITFQVYRNNKQDMKLTHLARDHFDRNACDAAGRHDLYGLQLQAAKALVTGGAAYGKRALLPLLPERLRLVPAARAS